MTIHHDTMPHTLIDIFHPIRPVKPGRRQCLHRQTLGAAPHVADRSRHPPAHRAGEPHARPEEQGRGYIHHFYSYNVGILMHAIHTTCNGHKCNWPCSISRMITDQSDDA